jgi:uncharacterized membrane protein
MKDYLFFALGLLVSLLWGLSPIITKHVLTEVSVETSMVINGIIYSTCIFLYAYQHRSVVSKDIHNITRKTFLLMVFSAIICGFLANTLFNHLMQGHKSHIVTALTYSSPIFTLFLANLLLDEKSDMYSKLGVFLITSGIVSLAFASKQ